MRPAISFLRKEAGNVAIQAVEVDVQDMPQAVLNGRIDIALGLNYADAPALPLRGVVTELLPREPFLMALRRTLCLSRAARIACHRRL
jgi:hypothetical protein